MFLEQVTEQRLLAVEKLEAFASRAQKRVIRRSWRTWQGLLRDAKGDEAARKLKNKFKRIKRDLRRASRAQGLGILDTVSSRLATEAKGYAFRYWANTYVRVPQQQQISRRARALGTLAAIHGKIAGTQAHVRYAWATWRDVTEQERRYKIAEEHQRERTSLVEDARRRQRSHAVSYLFTVVAASLKHRVSRAFYCWIDHIDAEEQTKMDFEKRKRLESKEAELAKVKREVSSVGGASARSLS